MMHRLGIREINLRALYATLGNLTFNLLEIVNTKILEIGCKPNQMNPICL